MKASSHFESAEKSANQPNILYYEKTYFVYIMTNGAETLYVGMTNNIERRTLEHKEHFNKGFTEKYKIHRLIYFEEFEIVLDAIDREKQIKRWRREKKLQLIRSLNPHWKDLSKGWYDEK